MLEDGSLWISEIFYNNIKKNTFQGVMLMFSGSAPHPRHLGECERCLSGMFFGSSHTERRRCHWMSRVLFSGIFISCLLTVTPFLLVFFFPTKDGPGNINSMMRPGHRVINWDQIRRANVMSIATAKTNCSESINLFDNSPKTFCLLITFPKEVGLI